jgi:ATP/maltotriose-dependent transcriptional regulator MalT
MTRPMLRQKLAFPPLWRGALQRERLLAVLNLAIAEGRHIGLFAGTGYGKTTLLAEWAREHPAVWITLDAEDADLDVFLSYLVFAFEQVLPEFRTEARELLGRAREREGAQAALSALLADLDEQCDRPLVLILDDYHLAASPSLDALIARLIKYLPPTIRLMLSARKAPAIELASLQAARRLSVIDEAQLVFDRAEIQALRFEQPEAEGGELLTTTGGWPAAMGMSPELLDAYLEEQLLAGTSDELRDFLQRLALVDSFDAALCEEALGAPLTRERREALLHDRLISPLGRERYVLHPALKNLLFRRFLADVGREERQGLLRRVGDYYWTTQQSLTGLRFWIDARQAAWAAERLVEVAEAWLIEGRLEALASALDALGAQAERPELGVIQGELYRRWGDFARAEQIFEHVLAGETTSLAPLVRARALLGQAQVAASRGNVAAAQAALQAGRQTLVAIPRYELDVLNLEGGLALLSGETDMARGRFEAAASLGRRLNDPYAAARALHNLGICYIRLGEFALALGCYDAGLATVTANGTPLIWMTPINRALVLIHLERIAEAEAAASQALALVRRYSLTREEGYALRILGFAQLRRGALEAARACFESAEQLARGMSDNLGIAYSLNFQAELAVAKADGAQALRLVDEVESVMGGAEAATGILEFAQVRAKVLALVGQHHAAQTLIQSLLARAQQAGYRHILLETERLAAQLNEAPAVGPAHGEGPLTPALPPALAPVEAPELRVCCFGNLRVFRVQTEISEREWQTARAKGLFAYFLFHGEGATKTRLLEAVYPNEEVSNDLMNMTLMRLRKALEPGLQKGQPSHYILRTEGRYAFNRQAPIALDTQEFENCFKSGKLLAPDQARVQFERGLALYTGEFLLDFDTPWVLALRLRYQALALEMARHLLVIYDEKAPQLAVPLLLRALEIDPLSAEHHRELILRYLEAEQPHLALQQYQLCERRYRELLDCPPPADLAQLVAR